MIHESHASDVAGLTLPDHVHAEAALAIVFDVAANVFTVIVYSKGIGWRHDNDADMGEGGAEKLDACLQVACKCLDVRVVGKEDSLVPGQIIAGIIHDSNDVHVIEVDALQGIVYLHGFRRGVSAQGFNTVQIFLFHGVLHHQLAEPV